MNFWDIPQSNKHAFILENGDKITYEELKKKTDCISFSLSEKFKKKCLGLIFASNKIDCIYAYLSALQANHAMLMLDQSVSSVLSKELVDEYKPDWIFTSNNDVCNFEDKYKIYLRTEEFCLIILKNKPTYERFINKNLALLLSTSGTTGSPKLVRLSYDNLSSNATSIKEFLKLTEDDRPITSLPLFYSYGLSVLNSHLLAEATILLTDKSLIQREFWQFLKENEATSLAGVPYSYRMLLRMGFDKMTIPSLRTLTQAGGALDHGLIERFYQISLDKKYEFYVMYGQTEATARISYVPFEKLDNKIGSIGLAIPNGQLEVDSTTSEIVYRGPNVMMGYCDEESDLSLGDVNKNVLYTGDIGYVDKDNFFYINGRKSRFIKLFGLRINLDDIERYIEHQLNHIVACIGYDDQSILIFSEFEIQQIDILKQKIADRYSLHKRFITFITIDSIPLTRSDKVDYAFLMKEYHI